jgi:hypothetical protein
MAGLLFDARVFISEPFVECPKCGKTSFGILSIFRHGYSRRCRNCLFPKGDEPSVTYPLPELDKKVIYIDQLAISNMMKTLNPGAKAHKRTRTDPFWLRLFERLDILVKLQLAICPDSGFHTRESLLSPWFEPLKRMYEQLSCGISFYDRDTIERFQICEHSRNWLSGFPDKELELDVHSVVSGEINAWQDTLHITALQQHGLDWINGLRSARDRVHRGVSAVFRRWQCEKGRAFEEWFEEESSALGPAILKGYLRDRTRFAEMAMGIVPLVPERLLPTAFVTLVRSIEIGFERAGVPNSEVWPKAVEYLTSPSLKTVPFNKIASMLHAALARQAAAGRKKLPTRGMMNDIGVISVLLPYCDAMFVDNECYALLKTKPLCEAIDYGTAVFSPRLRSEFLAYLDDIKASAPHEHFEKVAEVYGERWATPFTTLYTYDK